MPWAGLLEALLCGKASAFAAPMFLRSTLTSALAGAAGLAAVAGLISAKAAPIAEGVLIP